jgi:hypothetical protein
MADDREQRIGRNESLLRDVNEAIERGQWPTDPDEPVRFRCECAVLDCNHNVELTVREYERVRGNPRRFVVVHGHELPESESVVEANQGYLVVEKRDEAGSVAEELDPRS